MSTAKTSVTVFLRIDASAIFMKAPQRTVLLHPTHLHSLRQKANAGGHNFIIWGESAASHSHRITSYSNHVDSHTANLHGSGIQLPYRALSIRRGHSPHRHLEHTFFGGLAADPVPLSQQNGTGHAGKDVLALRWV